MATNLANRFFRYSNRLWGLWQRLNNVRDARIGAQYAIATVVAKVLAGIVTGIGSFNQMEKVIKEGTFDRVGGAQRPTADTLTYALKKANTQDLVAINDHLIEKSRRNKSLQDTRVEGFRVVALDGTGQFRTTSKRLGEESFHYRKDVHSKETNSEWYLAHALCRSYVGGSGPKPILDLRSIPQGEGEVTTAKKVIDELYRKHWRYCDLITVDALYAGAPFINAVTAQNKDVVVRVKQENYDIIKDAEELFGQQDPHAEHKGIKMGEKNEYYDLKIWDDENFTSWENVDQPLRVLWISVTRTKKRADGTILSQESYMTYLVTTCSRESVPALTIWKIAHKRWDIENTGFYFLKNHFQLGHAYSYDPEVNDAMLALFALAYNLFQLFVRRNLTGFNPVKDTFIEIMRQIHDGLVEIRRCKGPDLLALLE